MPSAHHCDLRRRTFLRLSAGVATVLPLSVLAGCSGSDRDSKTIRVAYQQFGSGTLMEDWITRTSTAYSAEHPDMTIELVPIVAAENDYFTKNELLMSSPQTSPDLVYEDTFILLSDVGAGYLQPIDEFATSWEHWDDVADASKQAVTGEDGKIYAIPTHTDTRGIWYQMDVFEEAGLGREWQPTSWEDILETARTIKQNLPEVAPLHIFSGVAQGEKASMQGFEMLLYGTESRLYNEDTQRWVLGSQGFLDSLGFLKTIFEEELTLPLARNLDPNVGESIYTSLLPDQKLGMVVDGNWNSSNWGEGGPRPWPEWTDHIAVTRMPSKDGQGSGWTTLAGGWSWTIPKHATDPKASFDFITALCTTENSVTRAIEDNHITVRADVAEVEEYKTYSPLAEFFTGLLEEAHYRPAMPAYPEVSSAIQEAMEAVMTFSSTPEQAAAEYDRAVRDIVGPENTEEEQR